MTSDPFSDILKLTSAETVVSGGFTAGGPWSIRFPSMDKITFAALVKGSYWLSIDGQAAPVHIEAGDVFLILPQRSFVAARDLETPPVDAAQLFGGGATGLVKVLEGDECTQIGGFVRLDPISGKLLTDVLPPLIHVKAASPQSMVLQWLVDRLFREKVADLAGAPVASAHLAQLMFVQILRAHLAQAEALPAGWLRALGDARIAPALRLMHGEPGKAWQLEELARSAAMSRTTFAERFKTVAGVPPLTYLHLWRMRLAERALRDGDMPLSALAHSLGYASDSAFSSAFKRTFGVAPKRYRDTARADAAKRAPAENSLPRSIR